VDFLLEKAGGVDATLGRRGDDVVSVQSKFLTLWDFRKIVQL
jgi:hypothetical protein